MKPFYTLLLSALPFIASAQDFAVNHHVVAPNAGAGVAPVAGAGVASVAGAVGSTVSGAAPVASTVAGAAPGATLVSGVASGGALTPAPATATAMEWIQEADLVNGSINKAKLASMKSVNAALVNFLQDSCQLGSQYSPVWHGEYFSGQKGAGSLLKFGLNCHFADQKAELMITANDIAPLMGHLAVGGHEYLTMDASGVVKNEGLYFEQDGVDENTGNAVKIKRWLVTTGNSCDRLPYIPVTRKEYLLQARMEVTAIKNNIVADWKQRTPLRSAAIQEAEKKAMIDQLNAQYSGMELQVRLKQYLNNYKTDEAYLKENTDKQTAGLDAALKLMDDLLAHLSAAELGKPAVVSVPAADFDGFEDGHTDRMLVRVNPAYFKATISEEKPQVFLVEWRYDATGAGAAEMDRQLMERFDGSDLKVLLGK